MADPTMVVAKHRNDNLQVTYPRQQQWSPLYPEATAEPELGDFRSSSNIVTTIELADFLTVKVDEGSNGKTDGTNSNSKKDEPTVAVIPVEAILPMDQQQKIGGLCCGFCCDYRRAVMWSNAALVCILCFLLVVQRGREEQEEVLYIDDTISDSVNKIYDEYISKINILAFVTVFTSAASIVSASLFIIWIPAFQVAWLISIVIASVFIFRWMFLDLEEVYSNSGAIDDVLSNPAPILLGLAMVVAAFVYPHVVYVSERNRGILTKETYPREERCCCRS